jgi:hypothetical protein
MIILIKLVAIIIGLGLILFTLQSAIRMLVLPRNDNPWLTRTLFRSVLRFIRFELRLSGELTYERRDRHMAFFAPVTLLILPVVWLVLIAVGYAPIYWALGYGDSYNSFLFSGSSLLTLGFAPVTDWATMLLSFSEATIGLILIAMVIAYLPTMYSAFSEREKYVTLLEVRAGDPPNAVTLLTRAYNNRGFDALNDLWKEWEQNFVRLEESHTSLAPLIFFRSPHPRHSWVTASGAIMDAAALQDAIIDMEREFAGVVCIRAGFLALRGVADYFDYPHNINPNPDDPISISREEFDEAYDDLKNAGIPVVADRDHAWRKFSGWRVNYDDVLLMLARMTMAPYAPWSSDRSSPRMHEWFKR